MSAPEEDKLVKDLREESLSAEQVAWGRADGGQDYVIAAQLADAAADRIEEQAARIAALEAEKAKAEALLAEAVEALEDIAKPRYGLQAVLEDGGSDDDIAHYYQSVCTQYHSCARATLDRIKEAKDNG